jgi:hypothetical protein
MVSNTEREGKGKTLKQTIIKVMKNEQFSDSPNKYQV